MVLTLLLGASKALAQQAYGEIPEIPSYIPSFEYHGCAKVNLNGFGNPIVFSGGNLTHESCQAVCEGQRIAAIFAELVSRRFYGDLY